MKHEGIHWHAPKIENVLDLLASGPKGLSSTEAKQRLATEGRNELREAKRIRPWHIFLRQFNSLLVWILLAATIIAGAFGDWLDCTAIIAILLLNGIVGFFQELGAEKSIAALKQMTAPNARVRRDGKTVTTPATEVVGGDILELEAGDLVAADARLIEAVSLQCMEAALTGESVPVLKQADALDEKIPLAERNNMVFMGTSVTSGLGRAIVVATGMETEIGKIASLIEAAEEEKTPLQKRLEGFGRVLVWSSLGIVALLFVLGWARGVESFELFMTSVSLAVAAVPEGLPAVVTIALAIGVKRMARRQALIRRLPAVETLGSTTVICTDKTGTLTVGEMTVRELYVAGHRFEVTGEGYSPRGEVLIEGKALEARHAAPLLELANILIGCNNAQLVMKDSRWEVIGDPTEGAMLVAGHKAGGQRDKLEMELPKHHEIPFDSDRKRRTVLRLTQDGGLRALTNGAPDLLLPYCTRVYTADGVRVMSENDRQQIMAESQAMASRGLRIIGSGYRDLAHSKSTELTSAEIEHDFVFVGLVGMYDPPRSEAKEAVAKCREAGIQVVMITGDHPKTALAIARELGIASDEGQVMTSNELERISDNDLKARVPSVAVFARVTAEHKLRIVRAWKANHGVVAMTGDGVNDAAAIKGSDIGIAMGRSGTEVTKQASDMVITNDNFASIVAAIEEGRGIYANIRKTIQYLLGTNAGELLLMAFCIAIGLPSPLLPVHLLWINLVTDGLPALSLATSPLDRQLLRHPPRSVGERIADRQFIFAVALTGLSTAIVAFVVYAWTMREETQAAARTYTFATVVFSQLFCAFGFLSETRPVWRLKIWANLRVVVAIAGILLLQIAIFGTDIAASLFRILSMTWPVILGILILSTAPLLIFEVAKALRQPAMVKPAMREGV